jgi:rhomboid family GlyGly-CTERM serine protease
MQWPPTDKGTPSWFRAINADGRYGVTLIGVIMLLWTVQLGGGRWRAALEYERESIAAGEWWRLVSAHFTHLDAHHTALNCLGLALLWALFARDFSPRRWLFILAATISVIDLGLWLLAPRVEWYLGASGVLHGVLAAGILAALARGERIAWVLLVLLLFKLLYEQFAGASALLPGIPVVPQAHLLGVVGGLSAALSAPWRPGTSL